MSPPYSDNLWHILTCPHCGGAVTKSRVGAACGRCQVVYPYSDSGVLNLRLQGPKRYPLAFELGTAESTPFERDLQILSYNATPGVDYTSVAVPPRLSRELMSHFPKASAADSLVLDLGCGEGLHRPICEQAGFEYVGLDYDASGAMLWGDAHALPFRDDSFEFVLSVAVLEHIQFPFVMVREAHRVLKPGGTFIGTVAFMEPFHGNSFYHHTNLGVFNLLHDAGFETRCVAPSKNWSVLPALAQMGFFPRLPHWVATPLFLPLEMLHRLYWGLGRLFARHASGKTDLLRTRKFGGSFSFIATKGATAPSSKRKAA